MGKTVRFIIGNPCAGKTHFREKAFADLPYIDLLDIQKEQREPDYPIKYASDNERIRASYDITRDRLIELMKDNDDVVLEHTLIKSRRRPMYIDAIRKAYPDVRILCYCLFPTAEEHARRSKERYDKNGYAGAGRTLEDWTEETVEERGNFEIPDLGEGFDQITIVRS